MASGLIHQLWILLRKNFRLKNNTFVCTSIEIVGPLIYAAMVYGVVNRGSNQEKDPPMSVTYAQDYKMDSYILGYAPANKITDELMVRAVRLANQKYQTDLEAVGFDSESQMMHFVSSHPDHIHTVYAFDNMTSRTAQLPARLHIILRPVVNSERPAAITQDFKCDLHAMQVIMESYIWQLIGAEHNISVTWSNQKPLITLRQRPAEVIQTLSVLYGLLLSFLIYRNVYVLADEREAGVQKLLKNTGVSMLAYWLSWFLIIFFTFWITSMVIGAMFFVETDSPKTLFSNSDSHAVLLYFTLFAVACTGYCFMGSVICHKADIASTIATCLFLGSFFPLQILTSEDFDIFAYFMLNKNIHFTIVKINELEKAGSGLYFFSEAALLAYFRISMCCLVYTVVTRILYHTVINKRSLWTLLPRTFCARPAATFRDSNQTTTMTENSLAHLTPGIVFNKMCADRPELLGEITLTIYQGQVTVVCDIDGNCTATFLSILTGENQPVRGSVQVEDFDIVKDISTIQQMTSICPGEQTVIFKSFTVQENLTFFHQIKSACQEISKPSRVQEVIDMFELQKHLQKTAGSLSPAEKRLLQIAIVYLGDSKVLLFDNPTLDMDAYTKSKSWNVIRRNTEEKVIIVCTESIEEAEMVGDMFAVVSGGLVRSYGNIEFIYFVYDIGYNLLIEKDANFDYEAVYYVITENIRSAKLTDDSSSGQIFLLPIQAAAIFYQLFTFLDNHKRTLGISRFSVNMVSLVDAILEKSAQVAISERSDIRSSEITVTTPKKLEVYFGSTHESQYDGESNVDGVNMLPTLSKEINVTPERKVSKEEPDYPRYEGHKLLQSQMMALFKKKAILNVCSFHLEILQMIILVTLAFGLYNETVSLDTRETPMDPVTLANTIAWVAREDNNSASSQLVQRYTGIFQGSKIPVRQLTSYEFQNNNPSSEELSHYNIIGTSFQTDNVSGVFKSVVKHSNAGNGSIDKLLPHSITATMNAFLHYFTGSNRHYVYASFLPGSHSKSKFEESARLIKRVTRVYRHHISFMQAVALLMVPYFTVLERKIGFKRLQHLSGASTLMYWTVTLASDMVTYVFLCTLYPAMASLSEAKDPAEYFGSIFPVGLASGVIMLLYIYVLQFAFTVPTSAAFLICLLNYFLGDAATIVNVLFGRNAEVFQKYSDERFLLLLPPSILPHFVFFVSSKNRYYSLCASNSDHCDAMDREISENCCEAHCIDDLCQQKSSRLLEKKVHISADIIVTIVFHLVFWTLMLILIETRVIRKMILHALSNYASLMGRICCLRPSNKTEKQKRKNLNIYSLFSRSKTIQNVPSRILIDVGIYDELARIKSTADDSGLIRLEGVDLGHIEGVSLTPLNIVIGRGKSYCFVDTDKATSSRILRLLSGVDEPRAGTIVVKGKTFLAFGKPSFTPIGYCMEINSIPEMLTGREILTLHAKLRGITDPDVPTVVEASLVEFNLQDKADRQSSSYGFSERLMLNIAVALIGNPEIILLDDPFGDLDVVSRVLVWQALDKSMTAGGTIIMCSDKIREVSDKVDTVAILMNGDLVCIGSPESIRSRYCCSYTLLAKFDILNRNLPIESLITTMKERFPKCVIFYDHQDFLHMRIPYDDTTLPDIFALMESAKKHLKMQSYKLVHTNLGNVLTAIQQRQVEDSSAANENDEFDTD